MRRAVEHLALFGEDQAAGVTVKQRYAQVRLKRADLPAHRRLAEAQFLAGMGEAARVGNRMKYPQFVPVHGRRSELKLPARAKSAAAVRPSWPHRTEK